MAGLHTTRWRWISGILGVTCLLLTATLSIVCLQKFSTVFHNSTVERVISPGTTNESQENPDCCSCQERWIGYQCSCYYISREAKSWNESRKFCASQKSTLLHMYNKDELKFMSFNIDTYWIGATYNVQFGTWQWGDGSDVSQDLYSSFKTVNITNCITYNLNRGVWDQPCSWKNLYICKQKSI